jgi:hypothetical protein
MTGENTMEQSEATRIVSPRFMALLNRKLTELDMTKSGFIRKFHADHGDGLGARPYLFKVLGGQTIIGENYLLPPIVKTLKLDKDEALKCLRADKIGKKGWAPPKYSKIVQEVADLMEPLSKRDKEEILQIAKMKAHPR